MPVGGVLCKLGMSLVVLNRNHIAPIIELEDLFVIVVVCQGGLILAVRKCEGTACGGSVIFIYADYTLGFCGAVGVFKLVPINILCCRQKVPCAVCIGDCLPVFVSNRG